MKKEIENILNFVKRSQNEGVGYLTHIDRYWLIKKYVLKADKIKSELGGGKVLDWGCGYGQMSYLLFKRGIDVYPFDIGKENDIIFSSPLTESINLKSKISSEKIKLPYSDNFFDAVLSCGTLEHVENHKESLNEIKRVLKRGGTFFIFYLPNKFSYIETIMNFIKKSCHDTRYSIKEALNVLKESDFLPYKWGYEQILPNNVSFLPEIVRKLYGKLDILLQPAEKILVKIPILNLFSTTIWIFSKCKK